MVIHVLILFLSYSHYDMIQGKYLSCHYHRE